MQSEHRVVHFVLLETGKEPVHKIIAMHRRLPNSSPDEWLVATGKDHDAAMKALEDLLKTAIPEP